MGKRAQRVVVTYHANSGQMFAYIVTSEDEQDAIDRVAAVPETSEIIGVNDGSGYPIQKVERRPVTAWHVPRTEDGYPRRYLKRNE